MVFTDPTDIIYTTIHPKGWMYIYTRLLKRENVEAVLKFRNKSEHYSLTVSLLICYIYDVGCAFQCYSIGLTSMFHEFKPHFILPRIESSDSVMLLI